MPRPVHSLPGRLIIHIVGVLGLSCWATTARAQSTHSLHVVSTLGGYVSGPGIDCGDGGRTDCDETYSTPATVTLQATASPGYQLAAWTAQCTDGNPTATVTVSGAVRCTAAFTPHLASGAPADPMLASATLFVDRVGSTVSPTRGILFGSDVAMEFPGVQFNDITFSLPEYGYNITFGRQGPGNFEKAYDSPTSPHPLLRITGCTLSVGRFRIYESSVSSGHVTSFAADFEALCSAPETQPRIVGAIRFNSSRAQVLPFDGQYPLSQIRIDPSSSGVVTSAGIDCGPGHVDCAETYTSARSVTLVATPLPGYRFVAWSDDCQGASQTAVVVDRWVRCSAVFNAVIPGFVAEDPRVRDAFLVDVLPPNQTRGSRYAWLSERTTTWITFSGTPLILETLLSDGALWRVTLTAPAGTTLQTGVLYENVVPANRHQQSMSPGLLVESPTGVCEPASGRFLIYDWSPTEAPTVSVDFTCVGRDGTTISGSFRDRGARSLLTPFAPSVFTPVPDPPGPDLNRDGSPDLVWRHRTSGRNAVWLMTGVDATLTTLLEPSGAAQVSELSWEIRATGDMNGDGYPDLIWQNSATGQMAVWFMLGATRIGTNYLYTAEGTNTIESDMNWKIVGAGDMDRDGQTDLLWRHRVSGAIRLWHMQGILQWDSVPFGTVSDSAWEIAGLADLNTDGLLDLVWRHYGSGAIATWFMYDTLVQVTTRFSPDQLADVNWRLVGVADLNADDRPDLVWQHLTTRELGVWFMDRITRIGGRHLNPPTVSDPNWRIIGVK